MSPSSYQLSPSCTAGEYTDGVGCWEGHIFIVDYRGLLGTRLSLEFKVKERYCLNQRRGIYLIPSKVDGRSGRELLVVGRLECTSYVTTHKQYSFSFIFSTF